MDVILRLRDANAETETPIYLVYHFQNQRLVFATKKRIHPDHWDFQNQRVKKKIKGLNLKTQEKYTIMNRALDEMIEYLLGQVNKYDKIKRYITPELLKKDLENKFYHNQGEVTDLIELANRFIKDCEVGLYTTPKEGKPLKSYTIRLYKTTLFHLTEFKKKNKRADLSLDSIGMDFYNSFVKYFNDKGRKTNTIGQNIKNIKVLMGYARDQNWTTVNVSDMKGFRKVTEEIEAVYLNWQEIEQLQKAKLKGYLKNAVDLFLVACWTGLRYADIGKLDLANMYVKQIVNKKKQKVDTHRIKILTQKTGTLVDVIIIPEVEKILKASGGKLKVISNQKLNSYIKQACKEAKINEPQPQADGTIKPKYELVSAHTARRSFATNYYMERVPVKTIMRNTGHKSVKTFLAYICCDEEEHGDIFAEAALSE